MAETGTKIETPEGTFVIVNEVLGSYRVLRLKDFILSVTPHERPEACIKQLEHLYGAERVKILKEESQ